MMSMLAVIGLILGVDDSYMGLAFLSLFQPQRRGSTYMWIDLYSSIYGYSYSAITAHNCHFVKISCMYAREWMILLCRNVAR